MKTATEHGLARIGGIKSRSSGPKTELERVREGNLKGPLRQ